MNRAGPILLAMLAVFAGCTATPEAAPRSSPSLTEIFPPSGTVGASGATVNLTGCGGSFVGIPLQASAVQAELPQPYKARPAASGIVVASIDSIACAKLAVNGLDIGPAHYMMVLVPIESPSTSPPPAGFGAFYIWDIGSNSEVLLNAFKPIAPRFRPATVGFSPTPLPAGEFDLISGTVQDAGTVIYQWNGSSGKDSNPHQEKLRMYSEGARTIDVFVSGNQTVNDGVSNFTARGDTALARGMAPVPAGLVLASRVSEESMVLQVNPIGPNR